MVYIDLNSYKKIKNILSKFAICEPHQLAIQAVDITPKEPFTDDDVIDILRTHMIQYYTENFDFSVHNSLNEADGDPKTGGEEYKGIFIDRKTGNFKILSGRFPDKKAMIRKYGVLGKGYIVRKVFERSVFDWIMENAKNPVESYLMFSTAFSKWKDIDILKKYYSKLIDDLPQLFKNVRNNDVITQKQTNKTKNPTSQKTKEENLAQIQEAEPLTADEKHDLAINNAATDQNYSADVSNDELYKFTVEKMEYFSSTSDVPVDSDEIKFSFEDTFDGKTFNNTLLSKLSDIFYSDLNIDKIRVYFKIHNKTYGGIQAHYQREKEKNSQFQSLGAQISESNKDIRDYYRNDFKNFKIASYDIYGGDKRSITDNIFLGIDDNSVEPAVYIGTPQAKNPKDKNAPVDSYVPKYARWYFFADEKEGTPETPAFNASFDINKIKNIDLPLYNAAFIAAMYDKDFLDSYLANINSINKTAQIIDDKSYNGLKIFNSDQSHDDVDINKSNYEQQLIGLINSKGKDLSNWLKDNTLLFNKNNISNIYKYISESNLVDQVNVQNPEDAKNIYKTISQRYQNGCKNAYVNFLYDQRPKIDLKNPVFDYNNFKQLKSINLIRFDDLTKIASLYINFEYINNIYNTIISKNSSDKIEQILKDAEKTAADFPTKQQNNISKFQKRIEQEKKEFLDFINSMPETIESVDGFKQLLNAHNLSKNVTNFIEQWVDQKGTIFQRIKDNNYNKYVSTPKVRKKLIKELRDNYNKLLNDCLNNLNNPTQISAQIEGFIENNPLRDVWEGKLKDFNKRYIKPLIDIGLDQQNNKEEVKKFLSTYIQNIERNKDKYYINDRDVEMAFEDENYWPVKGGAPNTFNNLGWKDSLRNYLQTEYKKFLEKRMEAYNNKTPNGAKCYFIKRSLDLGDDAKSFTLNDINNFIIRYRMNETSNELSQYIEEHKKDSIINQPDVLNVFYKLMQDLQKYLSNYDLNNKGVFNINDIIVKYKNTLFDEEYCKKELNNVFDEDGIAYDAFEKEEFFDFLYRIGLNLNANYFDKTYQQDLQLFYFDNNIHNCKSICNLSFLMQNDKIKKVKKGNRIIGFNVTSYIPDNDYFIGNSNKSLAEYPYEFIRQFIGKNNELKKNIFDFFMHNIWKQIDMYNPEKDYLLNSFKLANNRIISTSAVDRYTNQNLTLYIPSSIKAQHQSKWAGKADYQSILQNPLLNKNLIEFLMRAMNTQPDKNVIIIDIFESESDRKNTLRKLYTDGYYGSNEKIIPSNSDTIMGNAIINSDYKPSKDYARQSIASRFCITKNKLESLYTALNQSPRSMAYYVLDTLLQLKDDKLDVAYIDPIFYKKGNNRNGFITIGDYISQQHPSLSQEEKRKYDPDYQEYRDRMQNLMSKNKEQSETFFNNVFSKNDVYPDINFVQEKINEYKTYINNSGMNASAQDLTKAISILLPYLESYIKIETVK